MYEWICPDCGGKIYAENGPFSPSAIYKCDTCEYERNLNDEFVVNDKVAKKV